MKLRNKNNWWILIKALISFAISLIFICMVDLGIIKAIFNLYYGESGIAEFFKENNENVFQVSVRVTSFKLIIYRAFYSMIPIFVTVFLLIYYYSKALPGRITGADVFKKNPSLARILQIARYGLAFGMFFLIITFKRDYFDSTFHNCLLGYTNDYIRIILACIVFLVMTIDLNRFIKDLLTFPKRHRHLTNFAFILLISILSFCVMEFQIGSKTQVFVYLIHINIMYWLLLQLFILAISHNPKIGAIISLVLAFAIGLANDIVLQFRGNYIMFGDLTVVRTAMEVAGNYDYKPGFWFWISCAVLVVSLLFVIFIKLPTKKRLLKLQNKAETNMENEEDNDKTVSCNAEEKTENELTENVTNYDEPKPGGKEMTRGKKILVRIGTTILIEAILVLFVVITFNNGSFYGNVFGVGWDYNDNVSVVGYLPYFFSNMDSTVRVRLDDYSVEAARTELEEGSKAAETDTPKEIKEPNIIFVQNEAFSDLRITADIETDIDPMPFIHSLTENTQKGYLNMSVTGGPTSNTEFEILTRSSLQFLPYGAVPYTQYVKRDTPSLAGMLKGQEVPYYTVAYHSYYASGYNRNSVYDYLEFERKVFEDDFSNDYPESDLPRGYLSDEANYRKVIQLYEENQSTDNPFFCFNVTIQGHGGYTGGPYDLPENVKITNFEATDSMQTYMSLVKMSDTAFQKLVEYFEKVDEPTIIFMYGDHQPSFDDQAKEVIAEHPAWDDEVMQYVSPYYVPYVIWANFDIEEYDGLIPWNTKASDTEKWNYSMINKLSTNYAATYVMNLAGVKLSVYDRYLMNLHKDVPAITAIGVWDKDGIPYNSAAESPMAEQLHGLEIIQYNLVFDEDNCLKEYYLPGDD